MHIKNSDCNYWLAFILSVKFKVKEGHRKLVAFVVVNLWLLLTQWFKVMFIRRKNSIIRFYRFDGRHQLANINFFKYLIPVILSKKPNHILRYYLRHSISNHQNYKYNHLTYGKYSHLNEGCYHHLLSRKYRLRNRLYHLLVVH